jgi:hypothetical protein
MDRKALLIGMFIGMGCGLRLEEKGERSADASDSTSHVLDAASEDPSGDDDSEPDADGPDPDKLPDDEPDPDTDRPPAASDTGIEPGPRADCTLIEATNPAWEVCAASETECAGVFADGAGCTAYCAAASLVCTGRYGGEPGCMIELDYPMDCDASNGHASDWCICGIPEDTIPPNDDCTSDPADPPVPLELGYADATYDQRRNWVLDCRDYAYTALSDEHEECDRRYRPDGSRQGTATFVFEDVPRGMYEATMGGRHTENRNPDGALFLVDGIGVLIHQRDESGYVWDLHGRYCLEGNVQVVLDSTVNGGSDSVMGVRLTPVH